jgi:Bacterial Ig-like domain (group 3)
MRSKRRGLAAAAVLIAVAGAAMAITGTGPAGGATTPPGGIWGTPQPVPGLAALVSTTVTVSQVNDIHCSTPGNCVAIGDYDAPNDYYNVPFVVSETNGIWGSVQSVSGITPDPAVGDSLLGSLTCGTPDYCIATGSVTGSDGVQHNFLLPETDGVWSTATIMDFSSLPGATGGWVAALSCPADDSCTATGYYVGPSGMLPFTMDETAGTWGQPQPVAGLDSLGTGTATQVSSALWTVSCAAPGDCLAGGYYIAAGSEVPFTVTESGHTWGQAQAIPGLAALSTGSAQLGVVSGVACPDAGDCTVAGITTSTDSAGTASAQVFTLDESQGTWGQARALALPSSATLETEIPPVSGTMPKLSCRAAGDCVAGIPATITAGTSTTTQYVTATEASSGNWTTATTIPGIAAGNDTTVSGLTCAPAGDCYIYGFSNPAGSGTYTPFVATSLSASGFGAAQLISSAPKTGGTLRMSCAQPGYCALADSPGTSAPHLITEANVSEVISPSGFNETYGSEQSKPLAVSATSPAGGTPTGTMTISTSGTTLCTATLASGSASCTLGAAQLQAGSYPLTVSYSGDGYFLPSTFNSTGGVTLSVAKAATVTRFSFTPRSVTFNGSKTALTVTATVSGPVTVTGWASASVDGRALTGCTNVPLTTSGLSCKGTTSWVLTGGTHKVTVTYSGQGSLSASSSVALPLAVGVAASEPTLTLSRASVAYGAENGEKFTVSVSHVGGVYPSGKVQVRRGGTTLCTITLSKGTGSCSLTARQLAAGSYTLGAVYLGDANYHSSSAATRPLKVTG